MQCFQNKWSHSVHCKVTCRLSKLSLLTFTNILIIEDDRGGRSLLDPALKYHYSLTYDINYKRGAYSLNVTTVLVIYRCYRPRCFVSRRVQHLIRTGTMRVGKRFISAVRWVRDLGVYIAADTTMHSDFTTTAQYTPPTRLNSTVASRVYWAFRCTWQRATLSISINR